MAIIMADGSSGEYFANLITESDVETRARGPFGNPNAFGQFLAYGCTLAAAWFVTTHSARLRWGLLAITGVLAYALWLSLSRGAAATLLAGLVALAFTRGRAAGMAAAAVALLLVVVGYPLLVEQRLTVEAGTTAGLSSSDAARLGALLAAPAILAMSPVFGVGFGQYRYAHALLTDQPDGLFAHNWYATVLAEQGFLGLFLWLGLIIAIGLALWRRPADPRTFGGAMLCAFAVGCLFLQPPTSFRISIIPAIVVTAALVAAWDRQSAPRPPEARPAARSTSPPRSMPERT
jgi:O-antigen ligase